MALVATAMLMTTGAVGRPMRRRAQAAGALLLALLAPAILAAVPAVPAQLPGPIVISNLELVTMNEERLGLTWVTNLPSDTKIKYGTSDTKLDMEETKSEATLYHAILAKGLLPGTTYYYQVGSGTTWSAVANVRTLTPPSGNKVLSFAIIADPQVTVNGRNDASGNMYNDSEQLLRQGIDQINGDPSIAFVVMAGGLSGGTVDDMTSWKNIVKALNTPLYVLPGETDKRLVGWEQNLTNATGRTTYTYAFDKAGTHFVLLDTSRQGSVQGNVSDAQLNWLETDLASTAAPVMLLTHHVLNRTDSFGVIEPARGHLLATLSRHRNMMSAHSGHLQMNTKGADPATGALPLATTAALVQYPLGYTIVNLYTEGFTQTFRKVDAALQVGEESRILVDTPPGDGTPAADRLGRLEERSFTVVLPKNRPPTVTSISVSPSKVTIGETATVNVAASDPDNDPLTYTYASSGGEVKGGGSRVTWTAPLTPGNFVIDVFVTDGEYPSDTKSATVEAVEPPPVNHAPIIDSVAASPTSVRTGQTSRITVTARDTDGDTLTYRFTSSGGSISGTGSSVTWQAPSTAGAFTIAITVSDGNAEDSDSVSITVTEPPPPNRPPAITGIAASPTKVAPGEEVTVTVTASDPDNDPLTYKYTATGGAVTGTGATATWKAPAGAGTYTISVKVSDGKVESAAKTVTVQVAPPPDKPSPGFIPGFGSGIALTATLVAVLLAGALGTRRAKG